MAGSYPRGTEVVPSMPATPPFGVRMRIWFRPPMLFMLGSTTEMAKAAATAASAALPPNSSMRAPAAAARGWAATTTPSADRETWAALCAPSPTRTVASRSSARTVVLYTRMSGLNGTSVGSRAPALVLRPSGSSPRAPALVLRPSGSEGRTPAGNLRPARVVTRVGAPWQYC